jgi:hypothetical protein
VWLAQLLGGLDHDDERFDAGAGQPDHSTNLAGLALERFGGRDGQHHLARRTGLEVPLGVGRAGLDRYIAAGDRR